MLAPYIADKFYDVIPKTDDIDIINEIINKYNNKELTELIEYIKQMFYQKQLQDIWLELIENKLKSL